jgi:hypothetical protein
MPSEFAMPGCSDWKQSRPPVPAIPELDTANSLNPPATNPLAPDPPTTNPIVVGIRTIGAHNQDTDLNPTVTTSLLSPTHLPRKAAPGRRYP